MVSATLRGLPKTRAKPWSAGTCPSRGLRDLSRIEPWQRLPCLRAGLGATSRLSDGGDKSHAVHGALRFCIRVSGSPRFVALWLSSTFDHIGGGFYRGFWSLLVVCFGGVLVVFLTRLYDARDKAESGVARAFGCRAGRTLTRIGVGIGGNPRPQNRGGTPIPRFGPMCFSMRREIEPSICTLVRPAPQRGLALPFRAGSQLR